ncbi:MAG TPA: TolC family protein [Polyangia bacterium]|nr:TolC family protein [Polyangia bacterium]
MRLRVLCATLAFACAPSAWAQPERAPLVLPETVTLDDALKIFRQRGLDLLIADAAVTSAEGDEKIAGAVPNPNWSLFGSYTFTFNSGPSNGNAALQTPWGVSAGLGDSNALEDSLSGKRWLRLKVARAALAAARLNRDDAKRTLELGVKTAYIQAVLARDNLDFALQVQTGANQIFQLNQTRYNAGAISEADLAKVETMKLEADQSVDATVEALRAAKVQLAFLLGVRGSVPDYKVDQDLPKFYVPPALGNATTDSLVANAVEHRPDLRAAGLQNDRARAQVALAKRNRFPDLSLNLQYSQQAGTTADAAQPPTLSLGIAGTLPLFYFQQGEIKKAEADRRMQELQRAKVEAQLVSDVEAAHNAFVSSRKLVERMEGRLLERVKRARDLVSLQYQKGAASLLEYLDAQRTFIANNVEYLQDLASYWTAVYQLEAAIGMDLR